MLALLWAVTEDLASFAFGAIRSLFVPVEGEDQTPLLAAPTEHALLPVRREAQTPQSLAVRPATSLAARPVTGLSVVSHESVPLQSALQKNTVMYTASYATPVRTAPDSYAMRDVVCAVLPYGSMVMVLEVSGAWARISSGVHTGWVAIEDLALKAADVYPAFRIGEAQLADDPNTVRVRAIIDDAFGAGDLDLPLQAEEYVLYRLYKRGAKIAWPPIRPRMPGRWHAILKDNTRVTSGATPRAGALMEFLMESEGDGEGIAGHIALVEAVYPDETIQISEVNWPNKGIYNERVLALEEWQALNPVFLVIT